MSHERARTHEKTWTYNTPYDLVRRAEIIDEEGEYGPRALDMANFIDYVNLELPEGYMVVTPTDDRKNEETDDDPQATLVYRPGDDGEYELHASTVTYNDFYGDKIVIADGHVVVVNTELELGIRAKHSVKLSNVGADGFNELDGAYRIMIFKRCLAHDLLQLQKGEHKGYTPGFII